MTRSRRPLRVVLTGATSGIGKATALRFASRGAALTLGARREQALGEVAAECRRVGAEVAAVVCDVARPPDLEALADRAIEAFGGFDVWINNAGVLALGPLDLNDPVAAARVVEVNLIGAMLGTRAAVAHFKETGKGTVINVGSLLSRVPGGHAAAYAASKHGLDGLAAAVRQELVRHPGIRVCNVLPAGVDTPILAHAANYSGKAVRPYYPLVSPQRAARAITGCVGRQRDTVLIGLAGRAQYALDAVAPKLHRRVVALAIARALDKAAPAPPTDGTLFVSSPEDAEAVEGGLRTKRNRIAVALSLAVAGALAYVATTRRAGLRAVPGKLGSG